MNLNLKHLLVISLCGGLIAGISFPFTGGVLPLGFLAFVPVFIIQESLHERAKRRGLLRFGLLYLYFLTFNLVTTWWIYYASAEGAYMAFLANSFLMVLPFYPAAWLRKHLGFVKGLVATCLIWLSFEYAHFYWELSWPWLSFGHILGSSPKLMQWYEYTGVLGGSLWILAVNALVFSLIYRYRARNLKFKDQKKVLSLLAASVVLPVLISLGIYFSYEEKSRPVTVVVTQPNIEAHHEKFYTPWIVQLEKMFRLADPLVTSEVDLVVAPETAINIGLDENRLAEENSLKYVQSFQRVKDSVPVLIGAFTQAFFREQNSPASRQFGNTWYEDYNTALLLDYRQPIQTYHKSKLVLGSEKLPFVNMLPFLASYSVELGGTAGLLGIGKEPAVFETNGMVVAPIICYESVYGDFVTGYTRKGAQLFTVITNDGWWQDSPGYRQHRMFSQIRAIENRRSVARSANTGVSCFIDQRGDIIQELAYNKGGALKADLNLNDELTFYARFGELVGPLAFMGLLALLVMALIARFLKPSQSPA